MLNTGRDDSSKPKRRLSVVQLGQGKWPDDFIDAFKPPVRSREANTIKPPASRVISYEVCPLNGSIGSLSHLRPHRPVHYPRHSLDAPVRTQHMAAVTRAWSPTDQRQFPECRFCVAVLQT